MQISGRLVISVVLVLAVAMSGGAWLYQYNYSHRSAEFWEPATRLIVKSPQLELVELSPRGETDELPDFPSKKLLAGRAVTAVHDLSRQKGLIHLRHVFTQDGNFRWDERRREPIDADGDWAYALRFADRANELIVLFHRDFQRLGKLAADGASVDALPCPAVGPPLIHYLTDVGVMPADDQPAPTR